MSKKTRRSKITVLIFKILMSAALIIYLFFIRKIDVSQVGLSLKGVSVFWLMIGFVLLGVGRIITTYRWRILLSAQGIHIPVKTLIGSLLAANFFNLFLPSTIGGDAVRVYDTSRYSGRPGTSIMTIVIERMMGVFGLVTIACCSLILVYCFMRDFWDDYRISVLFWPVVGLFLVSLAGVFALPHPRCTNAIGAIFSRFGLTKMGDRVRGTSEILNVVRRNPWCLGMSFLLSLALQLNVIVYTYVMAFSLKLEVPFVYFCLVVPLINIILLIPFSINGIGISENAYVFFLKGVATASSAVALSWLLLLARLVLGAIGGVVYVARREPVPKNYG